MSGLETVKETTTAYTVLARYSPRAFVQNWYDRGYMESDDIAYRLSDANATTVPESYPEDTKGLRERRVASEELFDEQPE